MTAPPDQPPPTLAGRLLRVLPMVCSLGLLVLIAQHFEGTHLLGAADPLLLALALGYALTVDLLLGAFKWWRVMLLAGIKARFGEVLRLWAGLLPATFFMPLQSGHLLYVVALRNAKQLPTFFEAFECVAYDKLLSLVGTLVLIAAGQWLLPADHLLRHPAIFVVAVVGIGCFFADRALFRLLGRWRFFRERSRLLTRPAPLRTKLGLLGVATVYQTTDVVSMAIACRALGIEVDPALIVGAYPVVLLLSYLPISFNGFGVREQLPALLMATELDYDQAVASGLLVDAVDYIAPALVGLVALPHVLRVLARRRPDVAPAAAPDATEP